MTNRTASLLVLFVGALVATGVLMAIAVRTLEPFGMSGPWIVPVIAVLCHTTAFHLGRRYILPRSLASSSAKSAVTLMFIVILTMAGAMAGAWGVQWAIGRQIASPALTLGLWFGLLWLAVRAQHDSHVPANSSPRW